MTIPPRFPQLGDLLHKEGHIDPNALKMAVLRQKNEGGKLGEALISEGAIGYKPLYETLAKQQGYPFVDLLQTPCDPVLLEAKKRDDYFHLQAVPYAQKDGELIIATCDPDNPALHDFVSKAYNVPVRYVMTSPFDIRHILQHAFKANDNAVAIEALWRTHPEYSARDLFTVSRREKLIWWAVALLTLIGMLAYPAPIFFYGFLAINVFYLCAIMFKLVLIGVGYARPPVRYDSTELDDKTLPIYTLLVPLYQEERTLSTLLASIRALDYPKHKLDVKLIVEADDKHTINALKALKPERYFDILAVPPSEPRTKPKACNYAMRYAKGEYVTIYDAEDRPDPGQLKQAICAFKHGDEKLACVQARLNYHNRYKKFLPGLFALEYSVWFDFMLPGLYAMGMPIPLGGTSNHFKMEALQKLSYWDPFNVTEDADLGMRALWEGYRVGLIDSITWEEAPIHLYAWIKQRSRWIKGYMQTYFVHMRKPMALYRQVRYHGFFGFQMFIGAPTFIYLINPLMIGLSFLAAFSEFAPFKEVPEWLMVLAVGNLIAAVLTQIGFGLLSAGYHKWWKLLLHACLSPLYFLLHSVASIKALFQLITRPHYWEKTEHGVS